MKRLRLRLKGIGKYWRLGIVDIVIVLAQNCGDLNT